MLVRSVTEDAQFAIRTFVERQAAEIAQYIAARCLQHMEYAQMTGALPGEVRFDYDIRIDTYLR